MSRFLYLLCISVPLILAAADLPAGRLTVRAAQGRRRPAWSVQIPYNVTGPHAGKYHCDVIRKELRAGHPRFRCVISNAPDALPPVRPLLSSIDDCTDKELHPAYVSTKSRTVAFLSDELNDVTGTKGDLLLPVLKERRPPRSLYQTNQSTWLTPILKLKYVVLTLDHKDDVKKYGLDDSKFCHRRAFQEAANRRRPRLFTKTTSTTSAQGRQRRHHRQIRCDT